MFTLKEYFEPWQRTGTQLVPMHSNHHVSLAGQGRSIDLVYMFVIVIRPAHDGN
jgi:hypothetical protein